MGVVLEEHYRIFHVRLYGKKLGEVRVFNQGRGDMQISCQAYYLKTIVDANGHFQTKLTYINCSERLATIPAAAARVAQMCGFDEARAYHFGGPERKVRIS